MIAGKIIPAIATTTASICGLVMAEMLKLAQGIDDVEAYQNHMINLAINLVVSMEPSPPKKE